MDLYNLVTKIPYMIMLGVGLMIILQLYIGGLHDLSTDIDIASEEEYRSGIVLENLLTEDSLNTDLDYDERRTIIPEDFVTNEDPSEGEAGFSTRDGHCYIDEVGGLDGDEFAFHITTTDSVSEHADDPDSLECIRDTAQESAWSPALLARDGNPPVEVIVHVYPV